MADGRKHDAARFGAWLALALHVSGCAANTDADLPGSCTLQCSQKRVAAAEYIVEPLSPEALDQISLRCYGDFAGANASVVPLNGPVQVKYQIYENVPDFGVSPEGSSSSGGEVASALQSSPKDRLLRRVPRAGIGFEPWIMGPVAVDKTNDEHKNGDNTVSSFKFAGVVTPSSEWCSDSCGVMTYEVWPVCQSAETVSVTAGIAVAGAQLKRFVTISTQNQ